MDGKCAEALFNAIVKDDIKAFNALSENAQFGGYRFGRFPVLSLIYLYGAKKIAAQYGHNFIKIDCWQPLYEPVIITSAFKKVAGKCLRLYIDEIVSPVEMLMLCGRIRELKKQFPKACPSVAVRERLQRIYAIRYGLNVRYEGDSIFPDRRPLTYGEKRKILISLASAALVVAIGVGTPFTVNAFVPFINVPPPDKSKITKAEDIDFTSADTYTLAKDITLPANFRVENVNCTLDGNGKTITVKGDGTPFGVLKGSLSNANIKTSGNSPLFNSVQAGATVEDISVTANMATAMGANLAIVANTNYGVIENVTVNISGNVHASVETPSTDGLLFGGVVLLNTGSYDENRRPIYGTLRGCTVNFDNFTLSGEVAANATLGGIADTNQSIIENCVVTGSATSDTFDMAGICVNNTSYLRDNINGATLVLTSSSTEWNPIAAGICVNNSYEIKNCTNSGAITATSTCGVVADNGNEPTVAAAGIAFVSRGSSNAINIEGCKNSGSVTATAQNRVTYAAGICISSSGSVKNCTNEGQVTSAAQNGREAYASGITDLEYGYVYASRNGGNITANGTGEVYAGGITAFSYTAIMQCLSTGNITATGGTVYAGGLLAYAGITAQQSFFSVSLYMGSVENSICTGSVTGTASVNLYGGGIVGYIQERGFELEPESYTYVGGSVTNSYFTGTAGAGVGAIAGGCGKHIFDGNGYILNNKENVIFSGNSFAGECGTATAVQSAVSFDPDGNPINSEGGNAGATTLTRSEIEAAEKYLEILKLFEGQ